MVPSNTGWRGHFLFTANAGAAPASARSRSLLLCMSGWFGSATGLCCSPGHEDEAIERVVERRPEFVVVEKLGEAREQIDRDQPQQDDRD